MIFSFLREIVSKINAWQIRMVALACLVLFVGGGSQALVSAFAASYTPSSIPVLVVTQSPSDTVPGVHVSCKAVIRHSAAGIDVGTTSHYAFTLHCTPDKPSKRPTSSVHMHR